MSEKENYNFLKSGFNNVVEESGEDTERNIMSLLVTYAEGAIKIAGKYVTHGGRKGITPEDLKRGLMLEMFFFKKRDDILERANKIKDELFNEPDEGDVSEEDCDEDDFEEFKISSCECALCKCINCIYDRWGKWEPESVYEELLKKHIDDM
jgi:hypothetical protein